MTLDREFHFGVLHGRTGLPLGFAYAKDQVGWSSDTVILLINTNHLWPFLNTLTINNAITTITLIIITPFSSNYVYGKLK